MRVTRFRFFCPRVSSVTIATGDTTMTIANIIHVTVNGVHLVIDKTARISQRLNDRWVQANSHHPLLLAVCVIDPSLVRTVTLTIFIDAVKTFHLSVTPTKNVLNVARAMRQNQEKEVTEAIEDPEIISVVEANSPSVNNRCTSLLTNVTSSAFQKRKMIPK